MKKCCQCHQEKNDDAFWRVASRPDGLRSACKECMGKAPKKPLTEAQKERVRQRAAAWAREHPEHVKAKRKEAYWADAEGHRQAARHFRNQHLEEARLHDRNRPNRAERLRAANESGLTMLANSRKRLRGFGFPDAEVRMVPPKDIFDRDHGTCGICGESVDPIKFTLDHVIPLRVGGPHVAGNLQLAHFSCNVRKH